MYGFIEKWLADLIPIDKEPFVLNSGNEAVMLNETVFNMVRSILTTLWREDGDDEIFSPRTLNSDVSGMKILFHRYWSNEEILYGLTDGVTKASEQMVAFASLQTPRFDPSFIDRFKAAYENIFNHDNVADGEAIAAPAPAAETIELPLETDLEAVTEEPTEGEEFCKYFNEKFEMMLTGHREYFTQKGHVVKIIGGGARPNQEVILDLADDIDRNIFVFTSQTRSSQFSSIKNDYPFSNIAKHTLLFMLNPSPYNGFQKPVVSDDNNRTSICFGEELSELYCLAASNVVEKTIKDDPSLTNEEVDRRVQDLRDNPTLSIYSKYDEVFKDTYTNIVWGLRDRCFLYTTFLISNPSNLHVFNKCMKELGRRFNRGLTLSEMKEIDFDYQKEIAEKDKEKYIDFAISSATSIIDEFKTRFEDEKKLYNTHIAKAMEHGKLMEKLADHIDAFDEEKFASEQRGKVLNEYTETVNIPGVLSVNVKGKIVNVYTKNIYAQDERSKKWHDIGTFHIMIGMISNDYNTDRTVTIMNTKHQVNGMNERMQAPHVFSNGTICHGSMAKIVTEAYRRRDLFQLVYQLILFLQDANTDDAAGKYIDKWPEVPEDVAKGELSFEEEVDSEPDEAELKFDEMLAEAIPIHTS